LKAPPKLLSRTALAKRYGRFYKQRTNRLDPTKVPEGLQAIIPYAEVWGLSDDRERDGLVDSAPKLAKSDLLKLIPPFNQEFDNWLAGPEADLEKQSDEYLAFSNLRIAFDYLSASE
jgi:hypothetical protein